MLQQDAWKVSARFMFAKRTNWDLAPNRLSEALAAHRAAGKPLLDLTVSNPTECGFEYGSEAILNALRNPGALKYEPNAKGLPSARRAVAEYYAEKSVEVGIEDIIVTTSTSEAYSYVFRTLCNAGDEVLIPSPGYPLFDFLAEIQDVNLVRGTFTRSETRELRCTEWIPSVQSRLRTR